MKDKAIIFVSDDNYINHVKAIAVNCIVQGKYDGDFAVICPVGSAAAQEFRSYGFHVMEVQAEGFMQKFFVFSPFFREYEKCLYLDCDILVQDDLSRLFQLLERDDKVIWCDTEDGDNMRTLPVHNRDEEKHKELYNYVKKEYPAVLKRIFNTAFILFNPNNIPENIPEQLIELAKKLEPINKREDGGSDQQIINLLLWHHIRPVPEKLVGWWGFDEPENHIASEWRGWTGNEKMVALHYSRWYAQWIEKKPQMAAYWNRVLNISCNELYKQNLAVFDKYFKKV